MSKYTTEVRFICENGAGLVESKGYKSINQIITDAIPKIFDFEFPIFDETYRPVLERKILKHYYTREIGMETVGLWKHFLDMRLNEIMPYYNKLYKSELLQFNPLYDVDLTTDHSGSGTSASEGHKTDAENTNNTRTDNLTRTDDTARTDDFTRTDNLSEGINGTRTDNLHETTENTRKDNLLETTENTRTDNLHETTGNTRTDNLSKVTQDGGTQGESGSDVNKNTRWDIYSDTPQGALTNVQNEKYLTNARKIVDDGTGSTHSSTTTFGKRVTETDTGTVGNSGTKANTGTVTGAETKTNTGTVTDVETKTNTGTVKNTGTEKHTGTVKNTGNVQSNGTRNQTVGTTEDISTTDEYLNHVIGKTGGTSYSKLLLEYRETFMNIDMMIIDDLSDLFFNLW